MTLVCPLCFGDSGLGRRIEELRARSPRRSCDRHPRRKGVPLEEVAEVVDAVFREHFTGGYDDGSVWGPRGDDLEDALHGLVQTDDDNLLRELITTLADTDTYRPQDGEEAFYSDDHRYMRDQHALGVHGRLWTTFRESLLHEQRFFNADARTLVGEIFERVHLQRDVNRRSPVYLVRPGEPWSTFYRARLVDDEAARETVRGDVAGGLGPPPARRRRAGRLNPAGVAAFYGALDLDTCVAELRPTVGSILMGARFDITEPICVLDTTRFAAPPKEPNLFARDALRRMAQWRFMQSFMGEITQPVSPDDEHLDYVPTQAVAEYLVHHHEFRLHGGPPRTIDAVIYGSAQHPGGRNIAVLGDAAVVGPAATDEAQAAAGTGDWPGLLDFEWEGSERRKPVRIIARPETLEERRVTGAAFTSVRQYRPGDPDMPDEDWEK